MSENINFAIFPSQPGKSTAKLRIDDHQNTEFRSKFCNNCTLNLLNVYTIEIENCYFIVNFWGVDSSHTNIEICPGKLTIWNTTFYQSAESQMVLIVGGQSKEMVALNGICNSKQYENTQIRNS